MSKRSRFAALFAALGVAGGGRGGADDRGQTGRGVGGRASGPCRVVDHLSVSADLDTLRRRLGSTGAHHAPTSTAASRPSP